MALSLCACYTKSLRSELSTVSVIMRHHCTDNSDDDDDGDVDNDDGSVDGCAERSVRRTSLLRCTFM